MGVSCVIFTGNDFDAIQRELDQINYYLNRIATTINPYEIFKTKQRKNIINECENFNNIRLSLCIV